MSNLVISQTDGFTGSCVFAERLGCAVKSLEDVREPSLEPRISLSSPPEDKDLDHSLARRLGEFLGRREIYQSDSEKRDEPVYVGILCILPQIPHLIISRLILKTATLGTPLIF